jgi:hypothetical protein
MKDGVEMGIGAMIYIPSFIKIGSSFQNLMERGYTDSKVILQAYFYFFQNKVR